MDYLKYAFISFVGWGIWAIGSKLLSRHLNALSISFWLSLWAFIPLIIIFLFKKNLMLNNYSFYAIPVGFVSLAAILSFYNALKIGPASVVVPLTNMYVIFPVLFGFFILKESVTLPKVLGIIFAILATIFLSL